MSEGFRAGDTVVISERWRGRLWSAVPHRWVTCSGGRPVTHTPRGTVAAYASNRDLPYAAGLSLGDRKLEAMRTCVYTVAERPIDLMMLYFFMPGHWSRVNLAWTEDGEFVGWYVNFERPPLRTADGFESKDLVLDMLVGPDHRWRWKDADEFDEAVHSAVLPEILRATLHAEAERILGLVDTRRGPFAPEWIDWTPDPSWPRPALPPAYRSAGSAWHVPSRR